MGLRAFASQLLCEQVVGRGLRRTSYEADPETGLFSPEYVNVFGVPFTFLPHEGGGNGPPPPPKPKTAVEPAAEKAEYEISWPNVIRIDHRLRPRLVLDTERLEPLVLDAGETARLAELAPVVDGKPDPTKIASMDLETLAREFRTQRIVFEAARDVYDLTRPDWPGARTSLLAQLVRLIEEFVRSDALSVAPAHFAQDGLKRRLVLALNMTKVVQHVRGAVRRENAETLEPVFDRDRPIRSTGDMRPWYTGKPCERTKRSHVNVCVLDSAWEASDAFVLDCAPEVAAWAKNDRLDFEVLYVHRGVVRKYRPDFLVRLASGGMLVLETKGRESDRDRTKRRFLAEWVEAVNRHGGFGHWSWAMSTSPGDIRNILAHRRNRMTSARRGAVAGTRFTNSARRATIALIPRPGE